jgi:GNAT superfamily N-acetyltransferase
MSGVITRLADVADAERVGQLLRDFNEEFGWAGPNAAQFAARFSALLARDDVVVVLAEDGGQDVGFGFLTLRPTPYYDGSFAQLEELYVVPARRDEGIGTSLIGMAIDTVRARGAAEMHINVDEIDEDARRFYERHGFRNIEPGKDYRMLCYIQELSTSAHTP